MHLARIKFKLRGFLSAIKLKKLNLALPKEVFVLSLITLIMALLLIQNIYSSLSDLGNYEILNREREELEKLRDEKSKLLKEKNYYSSPYFVRLYARESQNLVEKGQEIYVVQRSQEIEYDEMEERMESIDIKNFKKWWINLVL